MREVTGSIPNLGKTFCCFFRHPWATRALLLLHHSDIIMFTTTMQADANASRQMQMHLDENAFGQIQMHLDENAFGQIQMHLDRFKCI